MPLATGLALGKTILASDQPAFRRLRTHRKVVDCRTGKFHLASGSFDRVVRRFSLRQQSSDKHRSGECRRPSWLSIASRTKKSTLPYGLNLCDIKNRFLSNVRQLHVVVFFCWF